MEANARSDPDPSPSFEEVVRLHEREIYRLLLVQLEDPEVAEDLTQETFVSAYRSVSSRNPEEEVRTWLCRFALEHLALFIRSRRIQTNPDEDSSE